MASWFFLALLSPLLFAIVNLIDDNLIRHVYKSAYFGAIISGLFGVLPLLALIFRPLDSLSVGFVLAGTLAGFLTVIYYFFYFKALSVDSPSVVIAIYSLSPAIVPVLAALILNERLNAHQITGFGVVLLACFALALTEVKKFKISKAFAPMVVATILYAISTVLLKHTYQNVSFYSGFMMFSLGMGLGGWYFLLVLKFVKASNFFTDLKRNSAKILSLFVLAEAIAIGAGFVQSLAIERGSVSLVVVIGGVQSMYVLLIALVFYKFSPKHFREAAEGNLIKKILLMIMIIFGLLLIYWNNV